MPTTSPVVFDHSGSSFRNRLYDQYKANRAETPADLVPQFALVRQATEAFGVCRIDVPDFEADDLIATYARHAVEAGATVTIVSSDKDMMQLVNHKVTMLDPIRNRPIGEAEVREKFGVGPDKVVEVQALCGDSVDNVPGVPGIGVKTAAELINTYGDLETLLAHAHEIKQPKRREALIEHEAKARLSKELVKLDDDVPLPCPLADLRVKPIDLDTLLPFLKEMEFRALATRMAQRLSGPAAAAAVVAGGPSEPVIPEILPFSAPRSYAIVDTIEGLDHWIEAAEQAGVVAIWPAPSVLGGTRPALCGLALALAPGMAAYLPLGHAPADLLAAPDNPGRLSLDAAIARLKPLLENPGVLKIGHDMKGAAHLLRRHGIALHPYDCTMLMSYVLDGGQVEHTIEELTRRAFAHELGSLKGLIGTAKSLISFAEVAPAAACDFAAERADAALRLHMLLKARLVREHMSAFYETIERPLVPVVAAMEDAGVKVDRAALAELSRDFARRIAELERIDLARCRQRVQHRLDQATGRRAVREAGAAGRQEGQDRRLRHRRLDPRNAGAVAPGAGAGARMAPADQAQIDLCRCAGEEIDSKTGRVHTSFALAATATGRLRRPSPTSRTSRSAPRKGARSAAPLSPSPGTCCCRPITARSNCAWPPMSPMSPS